MPRLGRWVRADPAEVFDDLLVLVSLRVRDAAEAAWLEVSFGGAFR